MIAVVQFSDLHVVCHGEREYAGLGPDTSETWNVATAQAFSPDLPLPDRVIITGDVVSNGTISEYREARRRLATVPVPTNVLLGNHDCQFGAEAALPSATVSINGAERHGPWLFVYVDTNAVVDADGQARESHNYQERVMGGGGISAHEMERVRRLLEASDAEFVWLWCHHTPNAEGSFDNPQFSQQIASLVRSDDRIRGVSSGHVHNNAEPQIAGVPVFVCPSLTLNFDVREWCTLPPGYREYNFADDGSVLSDLVWAPYPGFESIRLPDPARRHLSGEISWDEMQAELGVNLN